jgi:hypothetical protein
MDVSFLPLGSTVSVVEADSPGRERSVRKRVS